MARNHCTRGRHRAIVTGASSSSCRGKPAPVLATGLVMAGRVTLGPRPRTDVPQWRSRCPVAYRTHAVRMTSHLPVAPCLSRHARPASHGSATMPDVTLFDLADLFEADPPDDAASPRADAPAPERRQRARGAASRPRRPRQRDTAHASQRRPRSKSASASVARRRPRPSGSAGASSSRCRPISTSRAGRRRSTGWWSGCSPATGCSPGSGRRRPAGPGHRAERPLPGRGPSRHPSAGSPTRRRAGARARTTRATSACHTVCASCPSGCSTPSWCTRSRT